MSTPTEPTMPATPQPPRTPRRWAIPMAFVGGAAAVALAGGAVMASTDDSPTTQLQMVRGEHAQRGPDRAMQMQRRAEMDPSQMGSAGMDAESRGQHIAEVAQRLGVEVDVLTATLEGLHVERRELQATFADLEPAERRDAMRALADERRAALAEVLGVDADVLAELHAENDHGQRDHGQRGPQGGRMGPQGLS